MAIDIPIAQVLLAEHRYRPIRGTVVTIGRNAVQFSGEQADRLIASMRNLFAAILRRIRRLIQPVPV